MDPVTKARLIGITNNLAQAVNSSSLADCADAYQDLIKLLLADEDEDLDEHAQLIN